MENVWRVKGFLMPLRPYESLQELEQAAIHVLRALGGVELKILGEGTYTRRSPESNLGAGSPLRENPTLILARGGWYAHAQSGTLPKVPPLWRRGGGEGDHRG